MVVLDGLSGIEFEDTMAAYQNCCEVLFRSGRAKEEPVGVQSGCDIQ